ncbi:protein CROWDED NUCLEI 2 isoform X2 [Ricinus communis]|uniref:protein CROWDED NUCLEI 2 isoform X2 n=1 Tax=Ricinus communis TaxID=3988 RepID=UPI00201AD985|nr:protein CROWDED NUCLEI 2 isoform X2 [Ricinus communis]
MELRSVICITAVLEGKIKGKEMELLKLSKFKLQLQALATELRDLRERENSAKEQCHILIQKQKETEEEFGRKLQELRSELGSSNELCQKLERKESTCEMKRSIEARDRKLSVLNEKLNSHLSMFDSIEKEAFSIKQVMDNVQLHMSEKEEVVASLRSKMDTVSAFQKVFAEKVHELENKQKKDEDELRRKDEIILGLEGQLQSAEIRNNCQIQIEELQKTLSAKDATIQNLIFEREDLHCQVKNLTKILQKVKETVSNMDKEDKRVFNHALKCQENCDMLGKSEEDRTEVVQNSGEASPNKSFREGAAENQAPPACQEQNSVGKPLLEINHLGSCVPESPCSELQSAVNGPSISVNSGKVNGNETVHHLDSECSTTQAETSEMPGREVA